MLISVILLQSVKVPSVIYVGAGVGVIPSFRDVDCLVFYLLAMNPFLTAVPYFACFE